MNFLKFLLNVFLANLALSIGGALLTLGFIYLF